MVYKYQAVGRCIYCGDVSNKLTDEHIIPYSLNGALILPKASCEKCSKIISRYERIVSRDMFGNFRIRHDIQTRQPRKRPTTTTIAEVLENGIKRLVVVPIKEYPECTMVYKFGKANIFRGLSQNDNFFEFLPVIISNDTELKQFGEKYKWDFTIKKRVVAIDFARVLAKIAYSYIVGEFCLDSFTPLPHLLDVILGRADTPAYVVGGEMDISAPDPKGVHLIEMSGELHESVFWIIVNIRLFPAFGTPQYHVVVGTQDLTNPLHCSKFAEKAILP